MILFIKPMKKPLGVYKEQNLQNQYCKYLIKFREDLDRLFYSPALTF